MENNDESRVIISNTVIIVYLFLELLLDARAVHTIPCATFSVPVGCYLVTFFSGSWWDGGLAYLSLSPMFCMNRSR